MMKSSFDRRLFVCLAAVISAVCGAVSVLAAEQVRIAVGTVSVSSLPTWVAAEGGYFAREGLNAELIYIRGGPQTVSALIGGDVQFAQVYSQPILAARLTGADTVIVAGLINEPLFSIVAVAGIDKPEDLRGKSLGVTTFGSATDLAARLALKKWGLRPDADTRILQIRGVPEIVAALKTGAIHAGVVSPPTNIMAVKAGFKELAYLPRVGISFQHTTLATTRTYVGKNRATALKVLKAYVAAIERIRTDKTFASKVIAKNFKTSDSEVLEYTYNVALPLFKIPPYPTLGGIQATLDFMADREPKAREAQPKDFVDVSLLEEIARTSAAVQRNP
jgi:NitT/TauT family transport system substrate-binding protein